MGLLEQPKLHKASETFRKKIITEVKNELTIANFVSLVVRPALIIAATKVDIKKNPKLFSALWIAAIGSDGIDGWIAKHLEHGGSKWGQKFDILGDRIVEIIGFGHLAKKKRIPKVVPQLYVVKGVAQDGIRTVNQWVNEDTKQHILEIGNQSSSIKPANRMDRALYGIEKALVGPAAAYFKPLGLLVTAITTIHGSRRAYPVIFNPENKQLPRKVFTKTALTIREMKQEFRGSR